MIDIHCHILPLVDDGPSSYDEAMQMVEMAYADGTRCLIATPHRNHPFEFTTSESIDDTYQNLRDQIKAKYKDFGIVLGAELYITPDYLTILETKPYAFTMGDTNYVLIEFDRNILHKDMLNVVHECIIRGYRPIIAHIEMYPHLTSNVEKVRSMHNEGAYIQITASSITGKQGLEMSIFLKKLIRHGLVDFVASDGHKIDARRPRLTEAYRVIAGMLSVKDADRIFKHNPKALIANKPILQPTYAIKSGVSKVVRINMVAASVAILLIAAAAVIGVIGHDDAVVEVDLFHLEAAVDAVKEEASDTGKDVVQTTEGQSQEIVGQVTEVQTTEGLKIPTKDSIETEYYEAMKALERQYIIELEGIIENIKIAKENLTDEAQRKSIIEGYIDEIVALEEQSDYIVSDLLYDMQNELEAHRYDVGRVQELRDGYFGVKEVKQGEYLEGLGW